MRTAFSPFRSLGLLTLLSCFAFSPALAQENTKKIEDPAARIRAPKGFKVELIYSLDPVSLGSWVNMTVDPKGRLIVSDQYGSLYRVELADAGNNSVKVSRVEPIPAEIGEAQGLLWAFDALYVVVNGGGKYKSGLYKVTDSNGNDQLDKVELLREIEGGGEHGPHAVILAPDGKSLYVVAGNSTAVPKLSRSLVPKVWGEDYLLPRMVDGSGFMASEKAPGGYVCRVSPDGKDWDLVAMGFRNSFDIAFNRDGELFTYDSDMEWDVSTPWYRPTRVLHVVSGGDYGYRNGAGKWPAYYYDSLPPVVNVGPGSPTGIGFGYNAKFPAKYQDALYLCDWSYGKLYALHLKQDGASYQGELEEFIAGTPLALTDVVIRPQDGAMYFTVGGRRTQSGLYRVTYEGPDATTTANEPAQAAAKSAREQRHLLEAAHGATDPKIVDVAWPLLNSKDRFTRWAARVAIESQDTNLWSERALNESSSIRSKLEALLAYVQVHVQDPAHRAENSPAPDLAKRDLVLEKLASIDLSKVTGSELLDTIRLYQIVLNRFGGLGEDQSAELAKRFDAIYPAKTRELNTELIQLLVFLQSPNAAKKTIPLLEKAPTQEEQIVYATALRNLKNGWTPELQNAYFSWFIKAGGYTGGNSFGGFMRNIKNDAVSHLTEDQKVALKPILEKESPQPGSVSAQPPRPFVKNWKLDEVVELVAKKGIANRDIERGRTMFAATKCFQCHRYQNEGGGLGPDLTGVAGRFSVRDLTDSIVAPSKVISDQYETVSVLTTDGRVIQGRIVNLNGDTLMINPDMLNPNNMLSVSRGDIEELKKSTVSMMPEGLLDTLNEDEILDLMAYLLQQRK